MPGSICTSFCSYNSACINIIHAVVVLADRAAAYSRPTIGYHSNSWTSCSFCLRANHYSGIYYGRIKSFRNECCLSLVIFGRMCVCVYRMKGSLMCSSRCTISYDHCHWRGPILSTWNYLLGYIDIVERAWTQRHTCFSMQEFMTLKYHGYLY